MDDVQKEDRAGKIQGHSLVAVREGLHQAGRRIGGVIKRPVRPLEGGPVLSRLTAWFLIQDRDVQDRIINAGHQIVEGLKRRPDIKDLNESASVVRSDYPRAVLPPDTLAEFTPREEAAEESVPPPPSVPSVAGRRGTRKSVHPEGRGKMVNEPNAGRKDVSVVGKRGAPPDERE